MFSLKTKEMIYMDLPLKNNLLDFINYSNTKLIVGIIKFCMNVKHLCLDIIFCIYQHKT